MVGTSILGKSFIHFYRAVKLKQAFNSAYVIGRHYKGAFENPMSRREAALILGIRYLFLIEFIFIY
jgi:hypothetical protein